MKIHTPLNRRQAGASLMEVLIAMSISLVVTASMIALMANSLSSTARIVNMTKLADDMRVAMQMVTRDLRRSSYNASSFYCYANDDCTNDGSLALILAGPIGFVDGDDDGFDDDNCFTFQMDRLHDGDSTNDLPGAFRRATDMRVRDPLTGELGVDVLEMWTGSSAPSCGADAGTASWVQITDPEVVKITQFSINDDLSYTEVIQTDSDGNPLLSQVVRKFRVNIQSELLINPNIHRQIEDVITVRNDQLINHSLLVGT